MRQVRNLQVKCLNSKQGCKWQGDLGDCDDHMTNKCLAEATPCPMKCGLRGQRHKMRDHTNKECKLRPFPCRHCGREGVFDLITTSHYTICTSFPLPCPAGCPICLELVNDAKQTSCGHIFCAGCIKVLNQCPVCRVKCQIFDDNRTMRQVRHLQVKCWNSEHGCKWQGDLGECDDHMTKCLAKVKLCPMKCGVRGQRREMKDHTDKECKLRPFPCPHCGREGVFDLITTSHYTTKHLSLIHI